MFGGVFAFGNTDYWEGKTKLTKTFDNLASHYKVKIEYEIHLFYATESPWSDKEYVKFYIGEDETCTHDMTTGSEDTTDVYGKCRDMANRVEYVEKKIEHSGDLDLKFMTELDKDGPYAESWGIRNFKLSIKLCDASCATCDGSKATNCLSCNGDLVVRSDGTCGE